MEEVTSHHQRKSQSLKTMRVVVLSAAVIFFILFVQTFVFNSGNTTNPSRITLESDSNVGTLRFEEDREDPDEEDIEIDIQNDVDISKTIGRIEVAPEELPSTGPRKEISILLYDNVDSTLKSEDECVGSCKASVHPISSALQQTSSSSPPPPPPRVTKNIPVTPRKNNRKPRKRDLLKMKTYYRSDVEQLLVKNRDSPLSMVPRWPSQADRTFVDAKAQMTNAPIVTSDTDLHPPAYRNFSMFKRSYELMEKNLKVYVYKEGDRPVFHEPFLSGIYASEGWFMKHMEENQHFLVDDPAKAHLFYMPFSSRLLQTTLFDYKTRSKNRMYAELRNYIRNISSNYPYWNRSGGADHFAVCCHDWMETSQERKYPKRENEKKFRPLCSWRMECRSL